MKTIVFLGSNKSGTSRDALVTASQMGYCTILFTDRKKFIEQKGEFTEVNRMIFIANLLDKKSVLKELMTLTEEGFEICACISFVDPFVSYAAELSEELGINKITIDALKKIENKTMIRDLLKGEPYSPFYTIFRFDEDIPSFAAALEKELPLILKSPVSNGSKDVLLASTKEEIIKHLKYLIKRYPQNPVLIEEFIDGPQYLIEVMVINNDVEIVAIVEQEILNSDRFIITGYLLPANLALDLHEKLTQTVKRIIGKLGLSNGNCHLEMRMVSGEWKLIEINPRMSGGAMNRIILEGTGINLVKEILRLNIGIKPSLVRFMEQYVYAKFLTIDSRGRLIKVTGKNRASKCEGIKEVFVKPRKGSILTRPNSLGDRYAYVIASAESAEQARNYAFHAAKEIKFYLEPL